MKCVSPHVESVVLAAGGSLKGKNSVLEKVFKYSIKILSHE